MYHQDGVTLKLIKPSFASIPTYKKLTKNEMFPHSFYSFFYIYLGLILPTEKKYSLYVFCCQAILGSE